MIVAAFSLAFSAALVPAAPVPATVDSLAFDTTQVVVTQNDFKDLKNFLQSTSSLWSNQSVLALLKRHPVSYPLALGDMGGASPLAGLASGKMIQIPNYKVASDSNPAIAKGFTDAKLTPGRYMQLSRTLNNAMLTDSFDKAAHNGTAKSTDNSSVIGKNAAFIRANQSDFDTLVKLTLDVTPLRQQAAGGGDMGAGMGMGGGGDNLNP